MITAYILKNNHHPSRMADFQENQQMPSQKPSAIAQLTATLKSSFKSSKPCSLLQPVSQLKSMRKHYWKPLELVTLSTQVIFLPYLSASTNAINQNTARASLTQMIHIVFSKMEAYSGNFGIQLKKLQQETQSIQKSTVSVDIDSQSNKSEARSQKTNEEENKLEVSSAFGGSGGTKSERKGGTTGETETVPVNFNAVDQYVFSLGQMMVDYVCFHDARMTYIEQKYMTQLNALDPMQDKEEFDTLTKVLKDERKFVPLQPVPSDDKKKEESKKKYDQVELFNEIGRKAGKFGWCISCRNTANLYCRDTKHPVCSFECKQKHLNLADSMQAPLIDGMPNFYNSDEAFRYFTDAVIVFKSICKLCLKDEPKSSQNILSMRSKILGLELILAVLEKPGTTFLNRQEFIDIIRGTLCDGLLKYSVSNEKSVFSLSLSIFFNLFISFREHLKAEILIFLETIFLKILDSGNSIYHHKFMILTVFDKLSMNTKHMLEIFINYDCDKNSKDIFMRMIDSLSKIAQGKFSKSEHSYIITVHEEYSLRVQAIQILVQILRNVNKTIEAENMEFKQAQRQQSSIHNQRDSSINDGHPNSDEEEGGTRGETTAHAFRSMQTASAEIGASLDKYEQSRLLKNEMMKASIKFNLKPKNGIAFMQLKGYIAKQPQTQIVSDIVNFFKTVPSLDKTLIGDYLGEDVEINKEVLYEYIDSYEFTNMNFVEAIKLMLSGFRLPGEGQKVDRIMEKFGEKYCKDNPTSFGSAEAAYVLAYALMMLQTSLHNPQAKGNEMKLEDFKKMTKGINNGGDLPDEFIESVYRTVEKEPFTLAEDDEARLKQEALHANSLKMRHDLFIKEGIDLVKRGSQMMKLKQNQTEFLLVKDMDPVKPMFEDTWSANLAVFSVLLEVSDDPKITQLCIEGFIHAIKISGLYKMDTERDAFVSSLAKFTQVSTIKEIKQKNLECIQALLNLATYDGNYLRNSWYYVLDCISKIDNLIVMGTGAKRDSDFFNTQKKLAGKANQKKLEREMALAANSELIVNNIDPNKIDLIIQRSVHLDAEAIIDFITSLCRVSREELDDVDNPRKFSLQKVVEVADFNMGRIRFVWSKIWRTLAEHFSIVGCHTNAHVSMYAIDSLRQLADKFLLKEEFGNYHFQQEFLKPFETIMLHNLHTRMDIKDFIVLCISNMVITKYMNLKSGWAIVLNIFTLAAQDTEETLAASSFDALKRALTNNFSLLHDSLIELINCLSKFSKCQFVSLARQSLDLLDLCSQELSQKPEIVESFVKKKGPAFWQKEKEAAQITQYLNHFERKLDVFDGSDPNTDQIKHAVLKQLWFPILTNLNNIILEKRKDLQEKAITVMFKTFNANVNEFTSDFWIEILTNVLWPLLQDIHLAVEVPNANHSESDMQFYIETTTTVLENTNQFFAENKEQMTSVIPTYLEVLSHFITKIKDKHLAQAAITAFKSFIRDIGGLLNQSEWNYMIMLLVKLVDETLPKILLSDRKLSSKSEPPEIKEGEEDEDEEEESILQFNQDACFTKCISQLLLISAVREVIDEFFEMLDPDQIKTILDCLKNSCNFPQQFNQKLDLRQKLWQEGFMADLDQLPGLIRQERDTLTCQVKILFSLHFNPKADQESVLPNISKLLFNKCIEVIQAYIEKQEVLTEMQKQRQAEQQPSVFENDLDRQLLNLTPLISENILPNLQKLTDHDLRGNLNRFSKLCLDLTLCNNLEIRVANRALLERIFNDLEGRLRD